MEPLNDQEWDDVRLSAKLFGHISYGMYRTPAGAIKELISNAFDADAASVKIHTGFPRFEFFSCEDNGAGIPLKEFRRLMDQGFGTSFKRTGQSQLTPNGRPIIGRLGIGLLSLAQICTEFDLVSHHAAGDAFTVTIRFQPYTREEIDKLKHLPEEKIIRMGKYRVQEIDYDSTQKGVRVFTKYLRQTFRKTMADLTRYANSLKSRSKAPYSSFEEFISAIYEGKNAPQSLSLASDYDQLLFGLAIVPPIPYFNDDSNVMLKLDFFREYQNKLKVNEFQVTVDNLDLRRPLRLPSDKRGALVERCKLVREETKPFGLVDGPHKESAIVKKHEFAVEESDVVLSGYQIDYSHSNVAGRPLKFSGYLFQQTGRLYPGDIMGLLVRVRDVAIGRYDITLMNYPYGEGPRYHMVSCELFVEEGFEDALNIDRDSFNALDPHYIRMKSYLHAFLHTVVFPETWGEEKRRNKARKEKAKAHRDIAFQQVLDSHSKGRFLQITRLDDESDTGASPVRFSPKDKTILVNSKHPLMKRALRRKKYQELVEQIAIAFEESFVHDSAKAKREAFYRLLAKIFDNQL